jgi:hypothetical protein
MGEGLGEVGIEGTSHGGNWTGKQQQVLLDDEQEVPMQAQRSLQPQPKIPRGNDYQENKLEQERLCNFNPP